ncbi:MAG: DUF4105 domain-containing protein [Bacteroidaceae bacterium]|nr:DUF4105 domain-containing protein [Bacteroidaceae bacterium]
MRRSFLIIYIILVFAGLAKAESLTERMEHIYEDSIEVGLLTCYPGSEVYSLYGHTAIRFHNISTNEDWTFNYGVFNFKQKFFVLKFAFGKTDYELGMFTMKAFLKEYKKEGRKVIEQVLNLTQEEKVTLFLALCDNWRPENCMYRYNFFKDNCTTRARDIILWAINSDSTSIGIPEFDGKRLTWRENIHIYTAGHEWEELGNDLALGQPTDNMMTDEERQFLPLNLMGDFANATIKTTFGSVPLVATTRLILDGNETSQSVNNAPTPLQCIAILALIVVIVFLIEIKKKKIILPFDILLLIIIGLAGIVMAVLAISDHPATFFNWQILILTPLALVAMPFVIKNTKRNKSCWWDVYIGIAAVVTMLIAALKIQDIPMFSIVLAACLLTRCLVRIIIFSNFAAKLKDANA